ncbi:MAG TPA: RNA pseudouridine synthase [Candidatus Paceibacterota bacterium]|nr:RNA pseudouridine synthase [Candidatus Paceibacterota bacterium]HMP18954.1 RNA pseudouridine synthase [Candidatus Paceibacterota bacterium]HMP85447.1 RNA pseudouridine synthase [Candidatus Paceibacterota bacterium]
MLKILKQKKDYLLINKPSGLIVHSDGKTQEKNLCDFLLEQFPEIQNVGEPLKLNSGEFIKKPGIVHRLDRETSGIMIVALNQIFFEFIKKQFQDRKVKKTYHAFVYGNLKDDLGKIDAPIGRSKKDFRQWFSGKEARGQLREAITEYKVLKRSKDKKLTFVEVYPKTGRTHQIRVHFKHIYHPLISDSIYAPNRESLLEFKRTALHSFKIEFCDLENNFIECVAPYPEDFSKAITALD